MVPSPPGEHYFIPKRQLFHKGGRIQRGDIQNFGFSWGKQRGSLARLFLAAAAARKGIVKNMNHEMVGPFFCVIAVQRAKAAYHIHPVLYRMSKGFEN